jgi:hypothetical protein
VIICRVRQTLTEIGRPLGGSGLRGPAVLHGWAVCYAGSLYGQWRRGESESWNRYAYVEGDPVNHVDPTGLIAARTMCTAGFSTEECFGPGGPLSGELTGNGNGGMYCDQALVPFITTPAECSAYSGLVWQGVPSGVAQTILPVVIGAGGAVITGSGVTVGSIISGITGILAGIGIGEWILQKTRPKIEPRRLSRRGERAYAGYLPGRLRPFKRIELQSKPGYWGGVVS